jgi:hypothetical protein
MGAIRKDVSSDISPHYDVLIATPGKMIHAEYVSSLVDTIRWLESEGLSYKFLNKQGSLISSTRESTALDAYTPNWETREVGGGAYTYGKIFWIDSDIEWSVESFRAIYESNLDIVGGLYQTAPDGRVAVAMFDGAGQPTVVREQDFIMMDGPIHEVYGLGFGFIAMKSGVFEKCDRPWFLMERIRWEHLEFDLNVGEDYSFCVNARRNGFKVYLDSTIKVKHHKEIIYELR